MKYLVIITSLLLCFSISAETNSSYVIDGFRVKVQKKNDCYYLLAAGKEKERLICVDDEMQSDIIIKDFNFDGYKDIAITKEGANKRGNSSRLTQSFHFFMFEPFFLP